MKKHRGVFLGLGLAALLALSAGEAKAEVLTLSVIYNGHTFGFAGGSNAVTVDTTVINNDLAGSGYTFSNLGASSNFIGGDHSVGGYIADSAVLARNGGIGGELKIIVSEDGFTAPIGGPWGTVTSAPTATYAGTKANVSYQKDMGTYTPDGGPSTSTALLTLASNGTTTDSHNDATAAGIATYVTPYTLTLTQTINLVQRSSSRATDSIGGTVTAMAPVPEPTGLMLMVSGMAMPLAVAVFRRRRAAA